MNSEFNRIDDIFKKALEGSVEQPSSGVWRKISGRLFWKEITRFNFTNINPGWAGMAAAAIIVATLVVYNLPTTSPKNPASQNVETENPVNPSNPVNFDAIEQTEPGKNHTAQDRNLENNTNTGNDNDLINPEKTAESDNVLSDNKSDQTGISDHAISNNTEKQTEKSALKTTESNFSKTATTEAAGVLSDSRLNSTSEKTSSDIIQTDAEQGLLTEQQHQELEISQLAKRKAMLNPEKNPTGLNEIPNSGDGLYYSGNEAQAFSERSSGKIQKMHSLSFTLGQFFKGKYKPPKRDYEELNAAKYRGKNHIISLAAYFAPEMTHYTRMASTSREQNFIGGLAVGYSNSTYLLQGGIEFCYSNDLGDYMVNMQTLDSTGYYENIGSFTIDPENPDSIIFNTVPVAVWDSVPHQTHGQTLNQYSYLQFPLMLGYKAWERGLFSAYIKAGPSFSFLLNRKEPTFIYYNPDATIQNITNYTPTRLNASIQILVSLSLEFQATEKLGILVEPTYRYYLRSVYDVQGSSLKNPFGIGVRGGVFYNF